MIIHCCDSIRKLALLVFRESTAAPSPSPSSSPISDMAVAMDAALWGGLRDHIDLPSLIFAKLPLDAFFRLRLVCKEWNRLACDRAFLLENSASLWPPYFVVDTHSAARLLHRDAAWTWTRLPPVKCESSGLLMEDSDSNRVFDVHTRMMYALPDVAWEQVVVLAEEEGDYEEPVVGMIVDTSVKPYAFRVVLGDEVQTRIYDSGSGLWTQEFMHEDLEIETRLGRTVCAFCNGVLYIRVARKPGFSLHCYDVRSDEWDIELLPGINAEEWVCCDIGVWEDRLYMGGMNFGRRRIVAWELFKQPHGSVYAIDDAYDGTWRMFDVMPDDLWLWMLAGKEDKLKPGCWDEFFDIKSRFCGEYVLVYNFGACENLSEERAVLYNLDSMKWEKVDLPGSVA